MPERFFSEPQTKGPAKGIVIDRKGFEACLLGCMDEIENLVVNRHEGCRGASAQPRWIRELAAE